MPLRDHFRPPTSMQGSWEAVHSVWPGFIAIRLNTLLPADYRSEPRVRLGREGEADGGALDAGFHTAGATTPYAAWQADAPVLLLDTDERTPPEYEVQVYDEREGRRLVAAVEIVSPRNLDRPAAREAFVSKCYALLQHDVCVVIVDPVTVRAANLYAAVAARAGAAPPAIATAATYAVACRWTAARGRHHLEAWQHPREVGRPLPTLPLWFAADRYVPLELERTYEETCRGLRFT